MKLKQKDLKNLYAEVEDLTEEFKNLNPVIFLGNEKWFQILREAQTPITTTNLQTLFAFSESWLRIILSKMEKSGLITRTRKKIKGLKQQNSPYEWHITLLGRKILKYNSSKYKPSQRIVVFRCLLKLSRYSFAKRIGKKRGILSNWEAGNISIKSIRTAERYMELISSISKFENITSHETIANWDSIERQRKHYQSRRARHTTLEELRRMGRKGGKVGCRVKKRKRWIDRLSKQPLTNYEQKVAKYLNERGVSYNIHPIVCEECFDFRVEDTIIEAENKRGFAQSYAKASRLNEKARKVRKRFPWMNFIVLVPPMTSPETLKKLSEEYSICIFPKNKQLQKYIDVLNCIKKGMNCPDTIMKLDENKNSIKSRFKKLQKYDLIEISDQGYRNKWKLTEQGKRILNDFKRSKPLTFLQCIKKPSSSHNDATLTLATMHYWLFVNPSGHKTKKHFLSKGERFVKESFSNKGILYYSQYTLTNEVQGYPISRLVDGFVPPETIIEVKEIGSNTKYAYKTDKGSLLELQGQSLALQDFHPSLKMVAILLGKDKKLNKIPKKTYDILKKKVDHLYIDRTLKEYLS